MEYVIFMMVVFAAAFVLMAAADGAPGAEVETTASGCRVERMTIPSPSMGRDIRIAVVLPPAYEADGRERYPIIYALHGMGAPYDTFANMAPLREALAARPMLVACFDGDEAGWYIDATEKDDSLFETFFFEEFLPYLDAHYRTNGRRGLVGFSMGGFGAMYYTTRRPEMFQAVCTLSGGFFPFAEDLSEDMRQRGNSLEPLLGEFASHRPAYAAIDVLEAVRRLVAAGAPLPKIMVRCGTEDFLLEENRRFHQMLIEQNALLRKELETTVADEADPATRRKKLAGLMAAKGVDHSYTEQPGDHSWEYWRDQAPAFARFFWRNLRQ